jgi:tight adherence protein C
VEQDLPLALELFATMAEAGLGFDAALTRIVRAQGPGRALMTEFVNFQHDVLAGIPRAQALRQLARRVDVPSLTSFASAIIQAEQVGASMAETLQHQAVDLRQRRRENALLQAQALPVKLVFPLVICFLPGIFVSTLAPVLYQMVQVADSVLRSSGR